MGFKRSWVQIPPARDAFNIPQMNIRSCLVLIAALIVSSGNTRAAKRSSVRLNDEAFDFAAALIAQGHFIADKKGAWKNHHPTRPQENAFIQANGFMEYAKWHLAFDERHPGNSKARYKFPFGDFQNVHRCGLLAVKARAHEYRYHEIEDAAAKLLEMIESTGPPAQKPVN